MRPSVLARLRVSALTWPFPFLVRLGWATAGVPNPPIEQARGRVYLLRGNGIVFSRGFGTMCARFRRAGLWAEDLRCVGDLWVRRQVFRDHAAGRLSGPLILIGHSCGGRYALWTAHQLEQAGIVVDLLVCVDVAPMPHRVPGNVRRAIHLYRSRWRLYPARPLRPDPGSAAVIDNIDLDAPTTPIHACFLHHLNITASSVVQEWIIDEVMRTAGCTEGDFQAAGLL
jgi:pimeloyl-ACP methyl ester carboxylesterase